MKRVVISLLLSLCATSAVAQNTYMRVQLKNGEKMTFNVDSVANMTFAKQDLTPRYSIMDLVCPIAIPDEFKFVVGDIDSMTFDRDTAQKKVLTVHYASSYWLNVFHLTGIPERIEPDAPIDSISFGTYEVDTNVVDDFPALGEPIGGLGYVSTAWDGNRIYAAPPGTYWELDSNLHVVRDSLFDSLASNSGWFSFCINGTGDRLLSIGRYYGGSSYLVEEDLDNSTFEVIDSVARISSAVYFPGTNNVVYYSYDTSGAGTGYYLLDRATGSRTLLLSYYPGLPPSEVVNSFDISPDGKKLLFTVTGYKTPLLIEFDLSTHVFDTLNVQFNPMYSRVGLWVRYSHDGTKILYDNYPLGALDPMGPLHEGEGSEVGIIDRAMQSKQILQTSPTTEGTYVAMYPQWSPDDQMIVYSLTGISPEPAGYVSGYWVYILKSLQ